MLSISPLHVAIIMDGNGRWAQARHLPRLAGHRRGEQAVERTVEAATSLPIHTLTLYAFSSDNWRRPIDEVRGLMRLFRRALRGYTQRLREQRVRLSAIGRRDRLAPELQQEIEHIEQATAPGDRLHVRIAIDYSSRDSILAAAAAGATCRDSLAAQLGPPVDLLIRTGGEQRLSDFLLWESAYAELLFLDRLWPDFGALDLQGALEAFAKRQRRFGGLEQIA